MKRSILLTAFLTAISVSAVAQIYEWKDEKGRTVLSDVPPAGKNTTIKSNASPSQSDGNGKSLAEKDLDFKKRQQSAKDASEKQQKAESERAALSENCAAAKRQLALIESGGRITLRDDKGERYFLSDEQRQIEKEKTLKQIETNCR